jgi:hypothetical protein
MTVLNFHSDRYRATPIDLDDARHLRLLGDAGDVGDPGVDDR